MSAAATSARPGSRRAATSRSPSAARPVQLRRLFPGIRQRARRRLRAAALPAEGQQDRRGRRHHVEERHAGEARTTSSAASTRRRSIAPLEQLALQPAMRLRLDRGGQRPHRGAAMGEDARGGRDRGRGVGQVTTFPARPRRRATQDHALFEPCVRCPARGHDTERVTATHQPPSAPIMSAACCAPRR